MLKKIFKSRLTIAAICILIAIICVFAGIMTQENSNKLIDVVTIKTAVRKGDTITEEMISTKRVGVKSTDEFIKKPDDVIGKIAVTDLFVGEFVLPSKIAIELPSIESKLLSLDGSRIAISINIKDFACGLSDKLVSGDIVSCVVTTEDNTLIPPELTYVEVLATTTPSGIDKQYTDEVEEENLATATLLVTPYQAELLAGYDKMATLHLALSYRGDKETTDSFLKIQDAALSKSMIEADAKLDNTDEVTPDE